MISVALAPGMDDEELGSKPLELGVDAYRD
jgi:hypothetical protein